ncbi:MAG: beta-galactosidase trimerization domain-containing protein, partial [Paludibacteraceae bacterium]|nr:beta-galactosidase trimerization domain-containing protein [Paludibacteraceae bacterium]
MSEWINPSRRVAAVLAANGIPYDYIVAEKTSLTADDLAQYRTIIIPLMNLLDLDFKAKLETYVKGGGQLLILGTKFATNYIG